MYLEDVIENVDSTHKGLGNLVAICQLAVTARKMLLVISPTGCGKSRAMDYVAKHYPDRIWKPDSLSRAGLGVKADELNDSELVIVVDDLSTTQTSYARATTMTTLVALCYTHRVESTMMNSTYTIENFRGSALVGVQPIILKELLLAPEWEGSIKDKVLRYYHLKRPETPALGFPDYQLRVAEVDFDKVDEHIPDTTNKLWQQLYGYGLMQFSRARAKEHILDYLKASACLDGRTEVNNDDYILLEKLLRPMAFEVISITKNELEGERLLNNNLLSLLTEYYSYNGEFLLGQVALDYQVTIQQCYRILKSQKGFWDEVSKSPTIYQPSKALVTLLSKYNLVVKNGTGL